MEQYVDSSSYARPILLDYVRYKNGNSKPCLIPFLSPSVRKLFNNNWRRYPRQKNSKVTNTKIDLIKHLYYKWLSFVVVSPGIFNSLRMNRRIITNRSWCNGASCDIDTGVLCVYWLSLYVCRRRNGAFNQLTLH